jgi:superfamily II DNA or RNA helicase
MPKSSADGPGIPGEGESHNRKAGLVRCGTVSRKDEHHPIIFMQCGPVRYRVSTKQGAQAHPFDHIVMVRMTGFSLSSGASPNPPIQEIYELLIKDDRRNEMIFEDVMESIVNEKRSPVLITERREHLEMLAERFRHLLRNVIVFKGGMGLTQRKALNEKLAAIKDDEECLLIATGKYLGEGFDDARLDTLFLTLPISWKGTLAQYAGRLHRLHYSKREVRIYDYVDMKVPMLERMFKRRLPAICLGSRQYLEAAEKRLLDLCAGGTTFLM